MGCESCIVSKLTVDFVLQISRDCFDRLFCSTVGFQLTADAVLLCLYHFLRTNTARHLFVLLNYTNLEIFIGNNNILHTECKVFVLGCESLLYL